MLGMARALAVEVWSDIACPWCYIGKRRLEVALARFAHTKDAVVTWRAFQLDPAAPRVATEPVPYAQRLARKYNTTPTAGQQMIDRMVGVAREQGVTMDFERIRPSSTFDAHRLLHAARLVGLQGALKERLFRAYLCEGQAMAEHDSLARLARDVGMFDDTVQGVLHTDMHADGVRQDRQEAAAMGVDSVPFFVLNKRYIVAGAQPAAILLQALDRSWNEVQTKPAEQAGATCDKEDC